MDQTTVLALGKFNALHLGHRRLVDAAAQLGKPFLLHLEGMAETLGWEPRAPLLDQTTRQEVLQSWCVGELRLLLVRFVICRRKNFYRCLFGKHQVSAVVCGTNCRIVDRQADANWLLAHGPACGVQVEVVPLLEQHITASTAEHQIISSSAIRELLAQGEVAAVRSMLGRPYRLRGMVIPGEQRGRTLGFPTANLSQITNQLPALGVYAAWATMANGSTYQAAVNIGRLPTAGGDRPVTVEAHLLSYQDDCYGQEVVLDLHHQLRAECRFESLDQLRKQITADVKAQVAAML